MKKTIYLSLLFILLNLCDVFITYYSIKIIELGKEGAPIANYFLTFGFVPFLSFKIGTVALILVTLSCFYEKRMDRLLYIVNVVFAAIVLWNFCLLIISMFL
jgi:hypothetical protein